MDENTQETPRRRETDGIFGSHIAVPRWMPRITVSFVTLILIVVLAMGAGGVWAGTKLWHRQSTYDHQMGVVIANLQVLHEEVTIRDIVGEKLPKMPVDQQARIAFEIYDLSRRTQVPSWLILGIIETESRWQLDAGSSAGAQGLMQLMPGTAMAYARLNGVTITDLAQIREPIFNIRTGVQVLVDNHKGAVLAGKSYPGDYTRALWFYNGKGESYARLVMEKVVPYRKRLESPLQGKVQAPVTPEAPKS